MSFLLSSDRFMALKLFYNQSFKLFPLKQFQLKSLRNGPLKVMNKPSEATYELLTENRKPFHTHLNNLIPYYPKEL